MTRPRRGTGEGGLRERPDGRWEATLILPDGRRKYLYARSKPAARRRLDDAKADLRQGILPAPGRLTARAFLTDWVEHVARRRITPNTYAAYSADVRVHLVPAFGALKLRDLDASQIDRWISQQLHRPDGPSPRTLQNVRGTLRAALNHALKHGLVARNAAALAEPVPSRRTEVRPLHLEDVADLRAQVHGHWLEALYLTLLSLGPREGEAFGLEWFNAHRPERGGLDLERSVVHVVQQVQDGAIVDLKTGSRGRRSLAVPATLLEALRAHRGRVAVQHLRAGSRWRDHNLVFPSTVGTYLNPSNVMKHFRSALRAVLLERYRLDGSPYGDGDGGFSLWLDDPDHPERRALPRTRLHDLRHTAASLMLAGGVELWQVSKTLGHGGVQITLDRYGHLLPEVRREVGDQMEAMLIRTRPLHGKRSESGQPSPSRPVGGRTAGHFLLDNGLPDEDSNLEPTG